MTNPTSGNQGSALRPRARLLRTLGEELISNEVVAIIELVKNAYDADATRVLIRFTPPLARGNGLIEVIDNGHGMELKTIQQVWMEPATPSKRGPERRTRQFKRRYLGEKGIGRFAASRLADELEVVSRTEGAPKEVYAVFDWRQFDDDKKFLDEILVLWDTRSPADIKAGGTVELLWRKDRKRPAARDLGHGTILRMTGLKQTWEAKQFEDLRRGLARLISPADRGGDDKDGFEVELDLPSEFSEYSSKVVPPPILKHPHYTIKGSVNEKGAFKLTYKILSEGIEKEAKGRFVRVKDAKGRFDFRVLKEKEETEDQRPSETRTIECGPFDMEMRIWDRDELGNVIQKTHSTIQDIRRDLDAVAGINIYRDNFRVLPYGEPKDDWLRLDIRRVQNPTLRISNNQVYGVIGISADKNPQLHDQSNREGLDENQGLADLREVITEALNQLEQLRYSTRPRVKNRDRKPVGGLFSGFDLSPISAYIAKQLPDDKEAKDLVEATERAFGSQLKEIQVVLARYQRLALLGQLVDHVLHEGRQPIASIKNESQFGLSDLQGPVQLPRELARKLAERFGTIHKQDDVLATAFRRMEPFGGRRRGRPVQLYLEEIIRDAFAVFAGDLDRLKIRASLPLTETLVRVDPAEIQEVVINLLTNSLHWLEQTNEAKREIAVTVVRRGQEHVEISFSDSGPGVPAENRELIFEPYFTTKPDGIGLGLCIAGEIVTDYYEGSLELLDRGPLDGANFLITLRKRV
ncbi:MAG: ATP-binding protein [Elusimicrobia bacterium]|nr:ATP-binding protein [Elusimicrobiota bacterium]